jgi:DHA1 family multidrug resistance protein-like MFS transporter
MHLTLLRGLGGVADAIIGPALLALIAEVGGEEKGWAMGLFRGSQGIAIILGPIVGGVLAHYLGLYIPFYLDFTLTLLGVSLFFIPPIPEGERAESLLLPLKTLRLLRDEPRLLRAALIGFSELFSFGAFLTFLPALAISLELSDVEIASLLTLEAALFSLTNLVVGPLSDKVGRKPIAALGLLTYIIVLPSFPYAHSLWHLLP